MHLYDTIIYHNNIIRRRGHLLLQYLHVLSIVPFFIISIRGLQVKFVMLTRRGNDDLIDKVYIVLHSLYKCSIYSICINFTTLG